MYDRGVFRSREYARQLVVFDGLRYGNITPTDIDGVIEYRNVGYILFEVKHGASSLPEGQRIALERMCDDLGRQKLAFLVVASHTSHGDIRLMECTVERYRHKAGWHLDWQGCPVSMLIDFLMDVYLEPAFREKKFTK